MEIAMQMFTDEGLDGQLHPLALLGQGIYWLYRRPTAAARLKQRVVLLDDSDWAQLDSSRRAISTWMEPNAASELLWAALSTNGERTGEVVCGGHPASADYVFHREGNGYRVALPLRERLKTLSAA